MEFHHFYFIQNVDNHVKDVRWALDVAGKVEVRNICERKIPLRRPRCIWEIIVK
jgi:hypothetical protein